MVQVYCVARKLLIWMVVFGGCVSWLIITALARQFCACARASQGKSLSIYITDFMSIHMNSTMPLTFGLPPRKRYASDLEGATFVHDSSQEDAVERLQLLYEAVLAPQKLSWLQRLRGVKPAPVRGLYFWGGVGRGKTYLMDVFYDALPFKEKMRTHFHRFMRHVHDELTALNGEVNPLEQVAERISREARVICFDEFFVTDITDAMILAGLLEALFARGVTLVATSNIVPEGLYRDGLQRERFLPAIDLLMEHTEVVNIDGGTVYRLRALQQAALWTSELQQTTVARPGADPLSHGQAPCLADFQVVRQLQRGSHASVLQVKKG